MSEKTLEIHLSDLRERIAVAIELEPCFCEPATEFDKGYQCWRCQFADTARTTE